MKIVRKTRNTVTASLLNTGGGYGKWLRIDAGQPIRVLIDIESTFVAHAQQHAPLSPREYVQSVRVRVEIVLYRREERKRRSSKFSAVGAHRRFLAQSAHCR
jgi:hypothetical protein